MLTKNTIDATRRLFLLLFLVTGPTLCSLPGLAALAQSTKTPAGRQADQQERAQEDDEEVFRAIYRNFYDTYRLGPRDEIAIRVQGQPDYSLDRVKVSPVGRIYHPLLGEMEVAGLTVARLKDKLTRDISEYIVDPKVTVTIEQAQSAKLGVLGEVRAPGIVLMTEPQSVLDAIMATGGFTDSADRSDVTVLRHTRDGRTQKLKVDVKRILDGKSDQEANLMLRAGDTVIVGSNYRKYLANLMSLVSFASFVTWVAGGY